MSHLTEFAERALERRGVDLGALEERARELYVEAEREGRLREHRAECPCGRVYHVRYIAGKRPFAWLRAEHGRMMFLLRHRRHIIRSEN